MEVGTCTARKGERGHGGMKRSRGYGEEDADGWHRLIRIPLPGRLLLLLIRVLRGVWVSGWFPLSGWGPELLGWLTALLRVLQ